MSESVVKKHKRGHDPRAFKLRNTECSSWRRYAQEMTLNITEMERAFVSCSHVKFEDFLNSVYTRYVLEIGRDNARIDVGIALRRSGRQMNNFHDLIHLTNAYNHPTYTKFLLDNGLNVCYYWRYEAYNGLSREMDLLMECNKAYTRCTTEWTRKRFLYIPFPIRSMLPHIVWVLRQVLPPRTDRWIYTKIVSEIVMYELDMLAFATSTAKYRRKPTSLYLEWKQRLPTTDMERCAVAWHYGEMEQLIDSPYFTPFKTRNMTLKPYSFHTGGLFGSNSIRTKSIFVSYLLATSTDTFGVLEHLVRIAGPDASPLSMCAAVKSLDVTAEYPIVSVHRAIRDAMRYYYSTSRRNDLLDVVKSNVHKLARLPNFQLMCHGTSFRTNMQDTDVQIWKWDWFHPITYHVAISFRGTFACQDQLRCVWYMLKQRTPEKKVSRELIFNRIATHLFDAYGRIYINT